MANKHHSYVTNDLDEFVRRFNANRGIGDFQYESGIVGGHQPSTYAGSPKLWNAYWQRLGVNAMFLAYDVPEDEGHATFEKFLGAALESPRVIELTITDPFKVSAYRKIGEIGRLDDSARRIGNVNTVINNNGNVIGYNTDWIGAKYSLQDEADLNGATVLLEGIGGAGTAAGHAISDLIGQRGVLYLYNRTVIRDGRFIAGALAEELKRYSGAQIIALGHDTNKEKLVESDKQKILGEILPSVDVYANATNLTTPLTASLFDLLPRDAIVFDTKYAEKHTEEWRGIVERSGRKFISGLGMLYYQFVGAAYKVGMSSDIGPELRRGAFLAAAESVGYKPKFIGVSV